MKSFNIESALFLLLVCRSIALIWITCTGLVAVRLRSASFGRLQWRIYEQTSVIALIIIWGVEVWRTWVVVFWVCPQCDERYLKSLINPCWIVLWSLSFELWKSLACLILQVLSPSHEYEWIWFFVKSICHTEHFPVDSPLLNFLYLAFKFEIIIL